MKKAILPLLILISAAAFAVPAEARGGVHVDVGVGCCGYYPPGWGYYGYPSYYYVAPPPVAYVPPPVAYVEPPPAYYVAPPAQASYGPPPGGMQADQASPTYRDENGQTCREYQANTTIGGRPQPTYGTACLQPDGSWRVVK